MSKFVALSLMTALCLVGTASLFADEAPPPAPPANPKASGTIDAVDATAMTVTVVGKAEEGKEAPKWTFSVAAETKITVDGKDAKLEELKSGDPAEVEYTEKEAEGKKTLTAVAIAVTRPAAAPPAEPPKEEPPKEKPPEAPAPTP